MLATGTLPDPDPVADSSGLGPGLGGDVASVPCGTCGRRTGYVALASLQLLEHDLGCGVRKGQAETRGGDLGKKQEKQEKKSS